MIKKDYKRREELYCCNAFMDALVCCLSAGFLAVLVYRFGQTVKWLPFYLTIPIRVIYFIAFYLVQTFTGISVQAYAKIGSGFVIAESGCVFVVAESIGENFTVSQGVTVGNVRGSRGLPIIGDNVYIEPGAKVLGNIRIGNNVVIRANSLLLKDAPDNSLVCGNPARITPLDI